MASVASLLVCDELVGSGVSIVGDDALCMGSVLIQVLDMLDDEDAVEIVVLVVCLREICRTWDRREERFRVL